MNGLLVRVDLEVVALVGDLVAHAVLDRLVPGQAVVGLAGHGIDGAGRLLAVDEADALPVVGGAVVLESPASRQAVVEPFLLCGARHAVALAGDVDEHLLVPVPGAV